MDAPGMSMVVWLLVGLFAGAAHFGLLRYNTELYVSGCAARAIGVQTLRMATTTALLTFAAWQGTAPLLLTMLGLAGVRPFILRLGASAP
jgi:hypothetical protein